MFSRTHGYLTGIGRVCVLFSSPFASIKDVLLLFVACTESALTGNGIQASETSEIKLFGNVPFIEFMDAAGMKKLANVEFLSLSTNNISSIDNLQYCGALENKNPHPAFILWFPKLLDHGPGISPIPVCGVRAYELMRTSLPANLTILSLSRNKISSIRSLCPPLPLSSRLELVLWCRHFFFSSSIPSGSHSVNGVTQACTPVDPPSPCLCSIEELSRGTLTTLCRAVPSAQDVDRAVDFIQSNQQAGGYRVFQVHGTWNSIWPLFYIFLNHEERRFPPRVCRPVMSHKLDLFLWASPTLRMSSPLTANFKS